MQNTSFSNSTVSAISSLSSGLNPTVLLLHKIWEWLVVVLVFPLWPFAICFDIVTVIIFVKSPLGTTKTTRMYYVIMAAADVFVLISKDFMYGFGGYGIYTVGIDKLFPGGVQRWVVENAIGCASLGFIWFNSEIFFNLVFVLLDVERFIALYFPFKAKTIIRKRNMVIVLIILAFYIFCININWFWTFGPIRNPYAINGLSCSGTGSNALYVLIVATLLVTNNYILSTFLSSIFTILIVIKIRALVSNRHKVGNTGSDSSGEKKGLTAKQMEYFLTPLIISVIHILFYIPLAVFRLVSNILPNVTKLSADQSFFIYGFGFILYQLVMPVHLVNFLVYLRRIPGFAQNAKAVMLCRYSQIISKD